MTSIHIARELRNHPVPPSVLRMTPADRLRWLRLRDCVCPGLLVNGSPVVAVRGNMAYIRTPFKCPKIKRFHVLRRKNRRQQYRLLPRQVAIDRPGKPRRWPVYETPYWMTVSEVLDACAGVFRYADGVVMTAREAEYVEAAGERGLAFLEHRIDVKWQRSSKGRCITPQN